MTYYINLGGIIIYGVQNVDDGKDREITAYDGIGQGNFPVPESPKLHTWTIECEMTEKNTDNLPNWSAASKVFTAFDVLLATKDPSRFIFVSDNRSESMSGYLTGYSKKEKYPGTYDVTIRVTEYKAAGVKTTDVPYIKRPGKAPAVPKTVVFNSKTTPYSKTQNDKKSGGTSDSGSKAPVFQGPQSMVIGGVLNVLDTKTGKYVAKKTAWGGVSDAKTGEPVTNPATIKDKHAYSNSYLSPQKKPTENSGTWVKNTFSAIGNAFKKWAAEEGKRARNYKGGIS
ncbi:hypothetical protein [Faecalispora jeddahensis]|uniref:hypothetical protein n=1 Tax=Faecalispora jeddahensis TaxID=1414721 RepID=UPI0004B732F5|nr:hypothetical protein [Faecalispora jeddahensis]